MTVGSGSLIGLDNNTTFYKKWTFANLSNVPDPSAPSNQGVQMSPIFLRTPGGPTNMGEPHNSMFGSSEQWTAVVPFGGFPGYAPFANEAFLLKTDGSNVVRRLAHTRDVSDTN